MPARTTTEQQVDLITSKSLQISSCRLTHFVTVSKVGISHNLAQTDKREIVLLFCLRPRR